MIHKFTEVVLEMTYGISMFKDVFLLHIKLYIHDTCRSYAQ